MNEVAQCLQGGYKGATQARSTELLQEHQIIQFTCILHQSLNRQVTNYNIVESNSTRSHNSGKKICYEGTKTVGYRYM